LPELEIGISGLRGTVSRDCVAVVSDRPIRVLSSAVLNGGVVEARSIVNCHLPKGRDCSMPEEFIKGVASKMKLPGPTVGLMTAARMRNLSLRKEQGVVSLITAGLSNRMSAGDTIAHRGGHGTINTILLVDGSLTEGAMVEAVKTATEAKVLALADMDVRSRFSGGLASGTSTDSICVACSGSGRALKYAGTAMPVGRSISMAVRAGVEEAVRKQDGLTRGRPLVRRLEERGITLDDLVQSGMELFAGSGSVSRERAASLLGQELAAELADKNVVSLILGAMKLDEQGNAGLIPGLTSEGFTADPIDLVADEAIGMAIANHISGTLGVHNFHYYDRVKPGIIKSLDPFMDDAMGGLVAGSMSKVLRERP
jgi:adenosylcobinamide hydrolase